MNPSSFSEPIRIFVYGTLLKDFPHPKAAYLQEVAEFIGAATVPGRLYDLGHYPGLVYDANCEELVFGHIFQLHFPEETFLLLDDYEGIDPYAPETSEYTRQVIEVSTSTGPCLCWTYLYQLPVKGLIQIESGDYRAYFKSQNHLH